MVERRKRPTSASQYCVRGTDSLLYQREHLATRWDGALELGVNYMGNSPTVPFNQLLAALYPSDSRGRMEVRTVAVAHRGERYRQNDRWWTSRPSHYGYARPLSSSIPTHM